MYYELWGERSCGVETISLTYIEKFIINRHNRGMRRRRAIAIFISGALAIAMLFSAMPAMLRDFQLALSSLSPAQNTSLNLNNSGELAIEALGKLDVKGRAPKTGYERSQFGDGWATVNGCSVRDIILNRDLLDVVIDDDCRVVSGLLPDPYTGEDIIFSRERGSEVQIDHVIALSDAWQKGAQYLTKEERVKLANDPLELLAVSGPANQQKSDGDAATWLPKNKNFRCEYVARQIAIKIKYSLWVTPAERDVMKKILENCEGYRLPV